ncbi:MAG: hypothetical protein WDW36_007838 [Sanguina aurantia]
MDYHQGGAGATSGELPLTELELLIEHLAARSVAHTNKAQREELTYKDVGAGNYSQPDMSASGAAAAASFLAQNGGGFSAAAVAAAAAALMPAGVNPLAALQGGGMMGSGNASEPTKQLQQPQQQQQQQVPVLPTLNLA